MSLKSPIIIDLGSSEVKAGFRTENKEPSLCFPSYIGEPKYNKILRPLNKNNYQYKEEFIGEDCNPYLGILKLRYPIKHGAFENEKDISLIFNHIFSKLNLKEEDLSQRPLLITEPILNPKKNREMISTLLFEKYNIPALIFGYQPSLSLFAFSDLKGVIVESGEGVTQICSISEGNPIPSSFMRSDFGGEDVNEYLRRLLKLRGIDLNSDTEKLLLSEIKKKYVVCALDRKKEEITISKYTLPDHNVIQLEKEGSLASEVLLKPSLVGKNCLGIHQMIATCIEKSNCELREQLCSTIKLTGGNLSIKGLNEIMHTIIKNLLPKYHNKIKIKPNPNSTISCWIGGNIVANLGIFKDLLITKKNWEENGNDIIHKQTI
jgi:actin-related protein